MRRWLFIPALGLVALPLAAVAQESGGEPAAAPAAAAPVATDSEPEGAGRPARGGARAEDGEEPEASDLDKANDSRPKDFGGAADPADLEGVKTDHHNVERGDTLWDISGKYLGNPWYWPKVWSYNPEIENPHWIYPGDDVRFYPDDGKGEADGEKRELDDVSKGDFNRPDYGEEDDDVTSAGKIGFDTKRSFLTRHDGFVTPRELAESATIAKSPEEKEWMSEGDIVYLEWPQRESAKIGENYVIVRTARLIEHPEEDIEVGYITEILGNARVVSADPKENLIIARIDKSFSEIRRGDFIGPAGARTARRINRKSNTVSLNGYVLETVDEGQLNFGGFEYVFVDKGRRDGVEEGNTFDVVRRSDGLDTDGINPGYDEGLPEFRVAQLMVVDTKESASTAIVVYAAAEILPGDKIKMRQAKK